MRAYGIPRKLCFDYPDRFDVRELGLASRAGHLPTRSGEYRSSFKSPEGKARTRRFWKRKERRAARHIIQVERASV